MSPPRRSKSGINYRTWMKNEAIKSITSHIRAIRSPRSNASLARLSERRHRTVRASKQYNASVIARNVARVKKMLREIGNYEARRRHVLVRQPSGSLSLARRN